jgi:hypothetical protein
MCVPCKLIGVHVNDLNEHASDLVRAGSGRVGLRRTGALEAVENPAVSSPDHGVCNSLPALLGEDFFPFSLLFLPPSIDTR